MVFLYPIQEEEDYGLVCSRGQQVNRAVYMNSTNEFKIKESCTTLNVEYIITWWQGNAVGSSPMSDLVFNSDSRLQAVKNESYTKDVSIGMHTRHIYSKL